MSDTTRRRKQSRPAGIIAGSVVLRAVIHHTLKHQEPPERTLVITCREDPTVGVGFIVTTVTSSQRIFDAATFLFQAEQKWPGCETFMDNPGADVTDAEVNVNPAGGPSFTVSHYPDNRMVSIDGNPENSAEVAVWVRSLHPDPGLILWYTDDGFRGHTALFPGISADQVATGWIDHQEHDPYEEFPDYFQ